MLYDNALLARAYLHGWQVSDDGRLREVCMDTLEWVLREMRGPEGGFYSALDADSEGVEGRFYVWSVGELTDLLGTDAQSAIAWLGVTEQGNFADPHQPQPGLNVLTDRGSAPDAEARSRIRARLLEGRERRERPALDDKRLTSWNALMICALAEAGAALDEPRYLDAAINCAEFLQSEMREHGSALTGGRGRLLRTYNHGQAKIDAYLEDHAFLLEALIALFEATCDERWFHQATALAEEMIARFADSDRGGFFSTASDGEARPSACCASPSSRETANTSATRCPCWHCYGTSPRATPARSDTRCRRCTGSSRPPGRSPARSQPRIKRRAQGRWGPEQDMMRRNRNTGREQRRPAGAGRAAIGSPSPLRG
jgi:uncharacterized protein YyaL (SSP411 family)